MSFLALVFVNLRRHKIRTLIGVSGIGFGVARDAPARPRDDRRPAQGRERGLAWRRKWDQSS
jgi:hypothetical protein